MKSRYYENLPTGQLIPETDRKARYMTAFAKAFNKYDLLTDALYSEEEHGTEESYAEILRQKDKAEIEAVRLYNGLVRQKFRPGPYVKTIYDLWKNEIIISVQNRLAE